MRSNAFSEHANICQRTVYVLRCFNTTSITHDVILSLCARVPYGAGLGQFSWRHDVLVTTIVFTTSNVTEHALGEEMLPL